VGAPFNLCGLGVFNQKADLNPGQLPSSIGNPRARNAEDAPDLPGSVRTAGLVEQPQTEELCERGKVLVAEEFFSGHGLPFFLRIALRAVASDAP
jgi:hypothetical protein